MDIKLCLEKHAKWLRNEAGGERANLAGANLRGANLARADLAYADLAYADLSGAILSGANLARANLTAANLRGANLTDANLAGTNLACADLRGAILRDANMTCANLRDANLRGSILTGACLPHTAICPTVGAFVGFKKVKTHDGQHVVLKVAIPADAHRINAIGSRKIRANKLLPIEVMSGPVVDEYVSPTHDIKIAYRLGQEVSCADFCDDVREECAAGLHFFLTQREAEEWAT